MSSPAEKSRLSPLHSWHSGMFVRVQGVRLEAANLSATAPDYLCLEAVKRIEGGDTEIWTPVQVAAVGVPTLALLALAYADGRGSLRTVVALMSPDLRESLRAAIDDEDRADNDAMRADDLHDAAVDR